MARGTLTNFRTIRSRLQRLEELENTLESEQALSYSKKMISTLSRERKKSSQLERHPAHESAARSSFGRRPAARAHRRCRGAAKLRIKVVALLDTDCDPDLIDLPIPGNDDSMRSIELVINRLTDAIIEGKEAAPPEPRTRRRQRPGSRRSRRPSRIGTR